MWLSGCVCCSNGTAQTLLISNHWDTTLATDAAIAIRAKKDEMRKGGEEKEQGATTNENTFIFDEEMKAKEDEVIGECTVCGEEKNLIGAQCGHLFCKDCWKEHVRTNVFFSFTHISLFVTF